MSPDLEKEVQAAQEAVTKAGDTVRSLKASAKDGKVEKVGGSSGAGHAAKVAGSQPWGRRR